jgi:thiol:disulfide interchange protein DsbD
MFSKFLNIIQLIVFVFLSSVFSQSALAETEFLNVEDAFQFTSQFDQASSSVMLSWKIAPGYYLYKNKLKFVADGQPIKSVDLPKGKVHQDEYFGEQEVYVDSLNVVISGLNLTGSETLKVRYQGCAEAGLCYAPVKQTIDLKTVTEATNIENTSLRQTPNESDDDSFINQIMGSELGSSGYGVTLLMFFLLGLGLSFTPCVFPMYPILTGIIVGQQNSQTQLTTKRAFLLSLTYVQGMAVTYTLMGIIVAFAGMQFQAAFQHPAVLVVMSVIFVLLALSMFGVFNLALPSSLQQKLNDMSNQQTGGTYVGVALMGVISGLVASPCTTAPLTAALVYIAQSGDALLGGLALYALSLGMGVPLIALGSSGGKLLPKAGAWMNIVKNVFGFLLLMVPILLIQRMVPESVAVILWMALAFLFAGYLLQLNANSRSGLGYAVRSIIAFCLLFIASMQGYEHFSEPQNRATQHAQFDRVQTLSQLKDELSTSKGQYVLVDLYADWCIACKEFEKYTFSDPNVMKTLESWKLLQIDLTDSSSNDSKALMTYYQVMGLPTLLIFDKFGNEIRDARITGYLDAKQFLNHLSRLDK